MRVSADLQQRAQEDCERQLHETVVILTMTMQSEIAPDPVPFSTAGH